MSNDRHAVLTDAEINSVCGWHKSNTSMRAENDRDLARAVERAVVAKLRQGGEPVADERAAFEKWARKQPDHIVKDLGRRPDSDRYGHATAEIAWAVWQARAALVSAPVAGEAQPVAYLTHDDEGSPCMLFFDQEGARTYVDDGEEPTPLYAAPQASADAQDAARYRAWRKAVCENDIAFQELCGAYEETHFRGRLPTADEFDAGLDAAIAAQQGQEGEA